MRRDVQAEPSTLLRVVVIAAAVIVGLSLIALGVVAP